MQVNIEELKELINLFTVNNRIIIENNNVTIRVETKNNSDELLKPIEIVGPDGKLNIG